MKRKTAVKKLMFWGYSRNQANTMMRDKSEHFSNKDQYAMLAYAAIMAHNIGLPLEAVDSIKFTVM